MKTFTPKISVIVPTLNDEKYLENTIQSFISQEYANKELLIIDGLSSDNTLKIIKKYHKHISYWCSQKDKGISDAFNKGIKKATGDYLYFMGAGDTFVDSHVLNNMMDGVNKDNDWLVSGQIRRVSKEGQELYITQNRFNKWQLLYKMAIPHQGLFTNKLYFQKYGLFDTSCKYAMDYDLLLRAYSDFPKLIQKDLIVANWVEGGVGQDNTDKVLAEYHRIRLKNQIAPVWLLNIIYFFSKCRYGIFT